MSTNPRMRSDVLHTDVGVEHVLLDPTTEVAHTVTAAAAAVFLACDGSASAAEIADSLGLASGDVDAVLAELADAGLLASSGVSRRAVLAGAGVAGAAVLGSVRAARGPRRRVTDRARHRWLDDLQPLWVRPPADIVDLRAVRLPPPDRNQHFCGHHVAVLAPGVPPGGSVERDAVGRPGNIDGGYPYFYTTSSGPYIVQTINVPQGVLVVHPGPTEPGAIRFTNPGAAGNAVVSGSITRRDTTTSGDGVTLRVLTASGVAIGSPVSLSAAVPGASVPFSVPVPSLATGGVIHVVIDNGPSNDYTYDSTQLDLTITIS